MKHVIALLITSLAFISLGCKEKTIETHSHEGQTIVESDGNKKWLANAETTQGIQSMIVLTDAYLANPSPDLNPLKENLMSELTGIFQKCTMKDESHEQLHNYLLPLKKKLETLSSSDDVQTVEDIKIYLETYKDYFE
jgi:hypothetical protein